MTHDAACALLGIEPGADRRAIRQAYAGKLKAIDTDHDPAAFVALRRAMERALEETNVATPPRFAPDPPEQPQAGGQRVTQAPDLLDARISILAALLFAGESGQEWAGAIDSAWQDIMADPALLQLDVAQEVEYRLAGILAAGVPPAAPLLPLAIERFGWRDPDRRAIRNPDIAAILHYQRDIEFLDFPEGGGEFAHGRDRLGQLPSEVPRKELSRAEEAVGRLLSKIRLDHPAAEWKLDPERVEAWAAHLEAGWWDLTPKGETEDVFDHPDDEVWQPAKPRKGHWTRRVWPVLIAFIGLNILAAFLL